MVPALLLREVFVALVGGAGIWLLDTVVPLQQGIRHALQAAVLAVTLYSMAHVGGFL